jgi:hypothetical protein
MLFYLNKTFLSPAFINKEMNATHSTSVVWGCIIAGFGVIAASIKMPAIFKLYNPLFQSLFYS